eukprot:CAMPEP_0115332920 /NCGR_PEP_ID=MMETSP0270-20121206/87096_1 /TAXON_ID=71861 /ORGANISM="Scrippsiella trochoidea, Strain CCMP3099" /LENGTH=44 /DNA_ID= /DNA_START= /DNA_END= /DNA_ORIENTATION=
MTPVLKIRGVFASRTMAIGFSSVSKSGLSSSATLGLRTHASESM